MEFSAKLENIVKKNLSILTVGLDPDKSRMPIDDLFDFIGDKKVIGKNKPKILKALVRAAKKENNITFLKFKLFIVSKK